MELDVDGHTELDDLNVAGVSTFSGAINGTLATAAQANVTSVGTLTGLTVSADSTINGVIVGKGNNSVARNTTLGVNGLSNNLQLCFEHLLC